MNTILIKITIRRFFELLLTSAMISIVITYLHVGEVLVAKTSLFSALLTGVIVFILINVRMLRQCYFEFGSDFLYLLINTSAYMIFAGLSIAIYYFCSRECFTWIFAITKFMRFSNLSVSILSSVLIFHIISILMIFVAPVGMSSIFENDARKAYKDEN